jgi:hypothetical protein
MLTKFIAGKTITMKAMHLLGETCMEFKSNFEYDLAYK